MYLKVNGTIRTLFGTVFYNSTELNFASIKRSLVEGIGSFVGWIIYFNNKDVGSRIYLPRYQNQLG